MECITPYGSADGAPECPKCGTVVEKYEEQNDARLARYRELVNDPIAKAVANLIQPNQVEKFDETKGIELMRRYSDDFARLVRDTFRE